jgi:hypothetical protein
VFIHVFLLLSPVSATSFSGPTLAVNLKKARRYRVYNNSNIISKNIKMEISCFMLALFIALSPQQQFFAVIIFYFHRK